jgi:small conductance mechanosensitive channel
METLTSFAATYGLKIIGAILVLIIGRIAAGIVRKVLGKTLERMNTDPAIISFAGWIVYYLVIVVAVLAALGNFGIETASFVAVLGAMAFAIGFALQGSLSNFAAGIMLLIFRPFRIGDYVEAGGASGSVKSMGVFSTELRTPDNIKIIVPNGKIFGDTIKNVTAEDTRRIDLVIGIGYGSSIEKAVKVFTEMTQADARVLKDPATQIAVAELADSSVNFVVRPWVKTSDYWAVRFDLTRAIKEALDREGIEIPFPQMVVHKP